MGGQIHLDPKIKIAWMLPSATTIAIIWLILSAGAIALPSPEQLFGMPRQLFPIALFLLLLAIPGIPLYAWVHVSYANFTYELAETELIIREGIFTRKTIVIPYERIQNINSERTVFERLLGLATLSIETAATNPGESEALLPGISNRYELINQILTLSSEAKQNGSADGRAHERSNQVSRDQIFHEMLSQLVQLNRSMIQDGTRGLSRDRVSQDILAELRQLNAGMSSGKKPPGSKNGPDAVQSVPKKPKEK